MDYLDFKRLALSDPNNRDPEFVRLSKEDAQCKKLLAEIRELDNGLRESLNVEMPADLAARLQFGLEMADADEAAAPPVRRYAIAACFAIALFVGGFMVSNQYSVNQDISGDYQALLSAVVDHMHEVPITPVWAAARANANANALLASYDGKMQLKFLSNLQFSRICPMGRYKGLHASLETPEGIVTFAYIKGEPITELFDAGFKGYVSRIKPLRDGNLVIFSRTKQGLQIADQQLSDAIFWDA